MKTKLYHSALNRFPARLPALLCVALLVFGDFAVLAQEPQPTTAPAQTQEVKDTPKVPNDQLDSLVAPIALYPDPLLSQVLVASTYPLEMVLLQQWLDKTGKFMNEKAVAEAVKKENWDASVQAMSLLPKIVKDMVDHLKWTTDLGNAFLAQQSDVMDAVQRMRAKANDTGKLKSDEKIKVETQVVESKTVVVIEQADPEIVYVPSYDPTWVWGAMAYPYPALYYPAYYPGAFIGFGAGIAIGAAWGGGWGWGAGWGNNNINLNINNNFNRNANIGNIGGGNRAWQHNPQHRGGTPYSNRATAQRFSGAGAGQNLGGNRPQAGNMDLSGLRGGGNLGANRGNLGSGNRPQAGNMDLSGLRGSGGSGLGGDRIGSRDVSRGASQRQGSFGNSGSFGGGATRMSSQRGASSMGGGGFGGGRGGGGFGGGGRGGFGGGGRGGGGRR
jgi:hypothetical protein